MATGTPIKNIIQWSDGWFYMSRAARGYETEIFQVRFYMARFVGDPHLYSLEELKESYPDALVATVEPVEICYKR